MQYRALTQEEVDRLPVGARVRVTWSGGNGPHDYFVIPNVDGARVAITLDGTWVGTLTEVGADQPHIQVWVERDRQWAWAWGRILDHYQDCACAGDCEECGGEGRTRWGSFYDDAGTGTCYYCDTETPWLGCMYDSPDDDAYICLPCYLKDHRDRCGCTLWEAAERDVLDYDKS